MSVSHTESTLKEKIDGQKHVQPCAPPICVPSLRDLLSQHVSDPAASSCEGQNFHQKSVGINPDSVGTASLTQLMSEHEQNSKRMGQGDASGCFSALSSKTSLGASTSPSSMSIQSLSLGTLASLSTPLALSPSPPSVLSLGNLSLSGSKPASSNVSLAAPFVSLGTVLQNSQHSLSLGPNCAKNAASDHKVSPSLSDLIQEHSHRRQLVDNTLPGSQSSEGSSLPEPTLSLSELALQHQNRNADYHTQSTEAPANPVMSYKLTSSTPTCPNGTVSSSHFALQHVNKEPSGFQKPTSTEHAGSALRPPPGLPALLPLSHLVPQHKGKASTASTGSQYALTSLLSPPKLENTAVTVENAAEGLTGSQLKCKSDHEFSRLRVPGHQTIDLIALMAQSHEADLSELDTDFPSPLSSTSRALGLDLSVFARPSVFAVTLSVQGFKPNKRRRNVLEGKTNDLRAESGHQALLSKVSSKDGPTPLTTVVPFLFDKPSPDDIVRAKQRKAFTR